MLSKEEATLALFSDFSSFMVNDSANISYNEGKAFSEIKEEILLSMEDYFSVVEVIEDTDDYIISGRRCSSTKMRLSIVDFSGDKFDFISHQIVITYSSYFLMISFSNGIGPHNNYDDDLLSILQSIKLKK